MAEDCIFCNIANGKSKGHIVYEDDEVAAFLDIHPVNRGHTLVVPKKHFENIHDIPEELYRHVYEIAKKIAEAQKKAFSPAGISMAQNSGRAAGQIVFHFHTHVIPKDQEVHQRSEPSDEDLRETAEELKRALEK